MAYFSSQGQRFDTVTVEGVDPDTAKILGPLAIRLRGSSPPADLYLDEADAREIHGALHAYFADPDEPTSSAPADRFYVVQGGPEGELLEVVERGTGRMIATLLGPS